MISDAGTRTARAEARRLQVIEAARSCFQQFGFHGASMAQIACAAAMSVGQIYRFFPSKEAIIEAIVEEEAERKIRHIAAIETAIVLRGPSPCEPELRINAGPVAGPHSEADVSLFLEIVAEAARNPTVADILRRADRRVQERAERMVMTARPDWSIDRVRDTNALIASILDGAWVRSIVNPGAERESLDRMRRQVIAGLF